MPCPSRKQPSSHSIESRSLSFSSSLSSLLSLLLRPGTIPPLKLKTLLAAVAVILVMTRTRQLQTSYHHKAKSTSLATAGSLRHRRPKTKDGLEKEKRIRLLDEAIVTGDIEKLRRLSVTGAGFVNHGIRRRAWFVSSSPFVSLRTKLLLISLSYG